ncbi:small, acid-soluble spore protein K [Sporolactobacillus sp. CPB3-1]|uniref:Small, acid-soluble spore protein K n=1 Tax=Sporolactobacillus mangiferae TaxID=2940498 RepID=A0ABT0MBI4_9BACL|nr:small, acid-soluble spore protein K [Sporolactobacillus mangiferae]
MDKPGTRYSVQNEDDLWPGADDSRVSKRADGSINDRLGERMFSAHDRKRTNDHTEG